jgi:hypothetical protein
MVLMTEDRHTEETPFRSFGPSDTKVMMISDRVREAIDEAAAQASTRPLLEKWGRNQSREEIISKIRAEMWRTKDGQALRDLDRAVGSKPYSERAIATIRESKDADRFDVALDVLARGIRLPG